MANANTQPKGNVQKTDSRTDGNQVMPPKTLQRGQLIVEKAINNPYASSERDKLDDSARVKLDQELYSITRLSNPRVRELAPVQSLLLRGADIRAIGSAGPNCMGDGYMSGDGINTTLSKLILGNDHLPLVKFLIDEYRLNLRHASWLEMPALHAAVMAKKLATARYLLDAGAHVDYFPGALCTPLYHACGNHDVEMVLMLLKRGANVRILNGPLGLRKTALEYTITNSFSQAQARTVSLLLSYGADIYKRNSRGQDAYLHALACKNHEIARLIRKHHDTKIKRQTPASSGRVPAANTSVRSKEKAAVVHPPQPSRARKTKPKNKSGLTFCEILKHGIPM